MSYAFLYAHGDTKKNLNSSGLYAESVTSRGGPLCPELGFHAKQCSPWHCGNYWSWYNAIYGSNSTLTNPKKYSNKSMVENSERKVILSAGHNGFGNQIFQHLFAQAAAEYFGAELYVTDLSSVLNKRIPVNTKEGDTTIDRVIDSAMRWDLLPEHHPAKLKCARNNFTLSLRMIDKRIRAIHHKTDAFNANITSFIDPNGDMKCLISVGYFLDKSFCKDNARLFWHKISHIFDYYPPTRLPFDKNDMVIHIRCAKHPDYFGHSKS